MSVVGSADNHSDLLCGAGTGGRRAAHHLHIQVRNPGKNLPSRYKPGSRRIRAHRAVNCGFVLYTCAVLGNEVSPVAFPGYVGRLVETFAGLPDVVTAYALRMLAHMLDSD
jgi:hypothetical protein